MQEIEGEYTLLMDRSFYSTLNTDNYFHITLKDEEDIADALNKLRVIYPNIMKLDYDNKRTRQGISIEGCEDIEAKSPLTLVSEFYELQNNQAISEQQSSFVSNLIEKIWEGEQ